MKTKLKYAIICNLLTTVLLIFYLSNIDDVPKSNTPVSFLNKKVGLYIYIAAVFHNSGESLENWVPEVLEFINIIGVERVYVSIYENGSFDSTKKHLYDLRGKLSVLGVQNSIVMEDIFKPKKFALGQERIKYYSSCKNKALQHVSRFKRSIPETAEPYVLFLHDVYFKSSDLVNLLVTNHMKYDMACGMQFAIKFQDLITSRDISGDKFSGFYPFVTDPQSRISLKNGEPFQVRSCFSGLAVMKADLLTEKVKYRTAHYYDHCALNENTLLCKDFAGYGYDKVFMNPKVQVTDTEFQYNFRKQYSSFVDTFSAIFNWRYPRFKNYNYTNPKEWCTPTEIQPIYDKLKADNGVSELDKKTMSGDTLVYLKKLAELNIIKKWDDVESLEKINRKFPPLENDLIIRAAKREPCERTPVWIMRQAGRYLPEFKEVRGKNDFFKSVRTPRTAAKLTIQPIERYPGLDAAILFSDILVIPQAMGFKIEMQPEKGPVFLEPLVDVQDMLKRVNFEPNLAKELKYSYDALTLTRKNLKGRVPLIGFAGAPWTLMSYMIEGGSSKTFSKSKTWLYENPEASKKLLQGITDVIIEYLFGQIEAGAQLLQLFDSHAGELSANLIETFCIPYYEQIAHTISLKYPDVPLILFAKGANECLEQLSRLSFDVLSLDWKVEPMEAKAETGNYCRVALQGNLDPSVLHGSKETIEQCVQQNLEEFGSSGGHIANLGWGLTPEHVPEKVGWYIEAIHKFSTKKRTRDQISGGEEEKDSKKKKEN